MWEEEKQQRQRESTVRVKKMTTIAPSQEGQPRGDLQQQESVAHHAKYLWSRSREMSKQQPLHSFYQSEDPEEGSFSQDKDI